MDGEWEILVRPDFKVLNTIYTKYCEYKKFKSVQPLFKKWIDENIIIGYFDEGNLVAFSIIERLDDENLEALQFAWNYHNPKLRLGIKSLKHECAIFRQSGYRYMYLGGDDEYKKQIDGYEVCGPLNNPAKDIPSTFTNRN